ncbi:hypothetical protein KVV02_003314, partial [Mortierella alpina]
SDSASRASLTRLEHQASGSRSPEVVGSHAADPVISSGYMGGRPNISLSLSRQLLVRSPFEIQVALTIAFRHPLSSEADSSGRGDYSSSSRRTKKYKTKPTTTAAPHSQRHPGSAEDEDEIIRRDMERHARYVWRHWCEGGRFSDGHLVTLEKVIEYIDTEVLPKEEDILRQRMERTIAPVSGIESRILPVLHLWRKQELKNYDKRQTSHHNQFKGPLDNISHQQEPHVPAAQLGPDTTLVPGASAAVLTKDSPSGSASAKCKTNTIPATIILDSDDEKEDDGEKDHLAPSSARDHETTSADLEFLRNSDAKVHEISKMIASLCGDLKEVTSISSEQFPASIFWRLQSAQQQARDKGLETIFCEPLLLKVLEEHMRLVHDLNIKMARNDIVIVSNNTGLATASHVPDSTRNSSRVNPTSTNMHPEAKDDLALPKTGDQDDITVDIKDMEWEADAGSTEAATCPKFMSTAKSVLAALDDGPDDVPEMELFNKASDEERRKEDRGDSTLLYEMVRGDKSIRHVWEQWTVGVGGNPPIQRLEEQYGTRWRMAKDANYLNQCRCIVREIARLITDEGHTEEGAIQFLQDQLGNRAIGSFAIKLFKENTHRRKGKPNIPRRPTTFILREQGFSSSSSTPPLPEAPPPPQAPPLPKTPSHSEAPPLAKAQTPAEIWDELVRNSRLMDLKFFTPSPSAKKRNKSTAPKTPTRTKEASEASTTTQATPAAATHSANLPPTTTVAANIPASTAPKAYGMDARPSSALTPLKDPIAQMPTLTSTPASSTISRVSLSAQPPLDQPPTPAAPSVGSRSYKTAVEEAHRDVSAVGNSALAKTSSTLDSNRLHAKEPGMTQTTGVNTATTPASTLTLENTPAATVQAPSQAPTQVVHSTHPRTRASIQAQATPRPPLTTTKSTGAPSNNALALVYANALLTRFMASSKTQDPGPCRKSATGDSSATTTVTTVTAATAAMNLVSSTGPDPSQGSNVMDTSLPSALTISTPASVLTLAPVSAPAAAPVSVITLAQVPVPVSTEAATVAMTVRTRSASRKASNGTLGQTFEANSSTSMPPVSTPTTSVPTLVTTAAPTTAPTIAPITAPATASTTAPGAASTPAPAGAVTTGSSAGRAAVRSSSQFQYHMNQNNKTVFDIWTEWMEGINGNPSISTMNRQYGDLSWLPAEERELYRDQRMVLVEAEKLVRLRGMQVKQALEELEQKRIALNVDIKVLGKVLADNKTA